MYSKETVRWGEVASLAQASFNIWVDQPELGWARRAWAIMPDAGLADCTFGPERCLVFARFMVLASFYRDWCAVARDERHEDLPGSWAEECEFDLLHLGQAVGPDAAVEDVSEAFTELIRQERDVVIEALREGFGGDDLLFVSLWQSSQTPDAPTQESVSPLEADHEAGDEAGPGEEEDFFLAPRREDAAEILNNPTAEKLAAYAWLTGGCEYLGPDRFWSLE